MPTERFYNLPAEKRRRILSAARAELARVPCEELSINRIIREADISRGSFYQYFADKKDLTDHLMCSFGDEMHANVKRWLRESDGDLFRVLHQVLAFTMEFGQKPENTAVCRNLFAHLRLDGGGLPQVIRLDTGALLAEFGGQVRLERYRLESRQDFEDFLEVLVVLLRRAVVRAFAGGEAPDAVLASFDNQMDMLKQGVLKVT